MKETLADYLRKIRKEKRLTLRDVEEKTKISNAYLSQVENGKIGAPSPLVLNKLADCYGISYEHLMRLAGYPLPSNSVGIEKLKPSFRSQSSFDDLTEEEKKRVLEYIEFLKSRRR